MASERDPSDASTVFDNPDPFDTERRETGDDSIDDVEGLRLAGVRSNNPFAVDESRGSESAPTSTANKESDAGLPAVEEEEPVEPYATVSHGQTESAHTSAISPGTGDGMFQNTDPFGHAFSSGNVESESNAELDTNLQALNSHINDDRGERGTDIYANADPVFPEDARESSGHGVSDSDSDSGDNEKHSPSKGTSRDETDRTQGQIRFAADDEIDKAPTREDSDDKGNNSDSSGFFDKIKTFGHETKQKFHLHEMKATRPIKGFNPTNVSIRGSISSFGDDARSADREVGIIWRSRDNRKGRNSISIPRTSMAYPNLPSKSRPVYTSSFKGVRRNLWRMAFTFPYWDMAFWSGWSYTWGSVLFVIDGVWAWGPVGWDVKWTGIETYAVGIFFFIGALLYQVGAVMAYLEAVNDGSFQGSAMKRFMEGHQDAQKQMLDEKVTNFLGHLNPFHEKRRHAEEVEELQKMSTVDPESGWKTIHRSERPGSIYPGGKAPGPRRGGVDLGEAEEGESHEYLTWRWFPSWHALKTHHIYEIGYIACSIQLFGATLYSWCGLVSVPHLQDTWTGTEVYGGYWFPEIFGSCCFLTASVMFLLETQEKWWKIQPNIMGWWIGLWAKIGSWGFLLNGLFGVVAQARPDLEWAEFASVCCTTWGSFGYLCSALCQWYEAVNKHPVEELFDEPGDMKSFQVHPV